MFELALALGIYSYSIFLLGLLGLLYKSTVIIFTILFVFIVIFAKRKSFGTFSLPKLDRFTKFLFFILALQAFINLIGVLGPELSFDALWYHLTLPKIYLENHAIFHIRGSLLYYSDIPKNIEMIYVAALSFGNEILAKFAHYMFGILTLLILYKTSRIFIERKYALISLLIFYANLVVGWQSIAAYVDLGTTFFTTVSLYAFLLWLSKKNHKYLIFSAIISGLTVATKLVSLNLMVIYVILIIVAGLAGKEKYSKVLKNIISFGIISAVVASPWPIFAFVNTGNPFYPLFEPQFGIYYKNTILDIFKLFLFSQDPVNPLYAISIPLIVIYFFKFDFRMKVVTVFCMLSILLWYFDSEIGGSRFILPYLPAFSLLVSYAISFINKNQLKKYFLAIVILIALSSIGYRFLANYKYLPVILGRESKAEFLSAHLNFSFGDFYDTNGYFKNNIRPTDRVLLYGFHNLYYVDFPYIDSTWAKKGDPFDYIAVQNVNLPMRFSNWKLVYYNRLTNVKLYSNGGKVWYY